MFKFIKNWWNKSDVFHDRYGDTWMDYPGVGKITDNDIADMVLKHSRFLDRFDAKKMIHAAIWAESYCMKVIDPPEKENWKF